VANIASAEKKNRQRIKRAARNTAHMSKVRTYVKKVMTAVAAKDKKATEALKEAIKVIDKAAQRGVLKKETASRKISRLTKQVTAALSAAAKR
jgi:small subunit ribosomal protein S20